MAVVRSLYCAFLLCSVVMLFTVNCNCFNEQINDDDDDDDDDDYDDDGDDDDCNAKCMVSIDLSLCTKTE